MPHIHTVRADAFIRPMFVGRTQPFLLSCINAHGEQSEYVVKLHGQLESGIVNEYWCARLGDILNMPLPTMVIVEIDERLGLFDSHLADSLKKQVGPHFGSKHIGPQMKDFTGGVDADNFDTAVGIFAFDYLVQNADRRKTNSNLFLADGKFWMIDHELSLGFNRTLWVYELPWNIPLNNPMWADHVLFRDLKGKVQSDYLDGFVSKLSKIEQATIESIANDMPASWNYDRLNALIVEYLLEILNDLPRFQRGVLEVLA